MYELEVFADLAPQPEWRTEGAPGRFRRIYHHALTRLNALQERHIQITVGPPAEFFWRCKQGTPDRAYLSLPTTRTEPIELARRSANDVNSLPASHEKRARSEQRFKQSAPTPPITTNIDELGNVSGPARPRSRDCR